MGCPGFLSVVDDLCEGVNAKTGPGKLMKHLVQNFTENELDTLRL
jgi:hypothetical protein